MFEDIQSFFTTRPKRPDSSLGAGASAEDDPAIPAFQKAWKDGALVEDMFGPSPFTLHGSIGRSGWHNANLDQAIRTFQKDKGLEVDGFLRVKTYKIAFVGKHPVIQGSRREPLDDRSPFLADRRSVRAA